MKRGAETSAPSSNNRRMGRPPTLVTHFIQRGGNFFCKHCSEATRRPIAHGSFWHHLNSQHTGTHDVFDSNGNVLPFKNNAQREDDLSPDDIQQPMEDEPPNDIQQQPMAAISSFEQLSATASFQQAAQHVPLRARAKRGPVTITALQSVFYSAGADRTVAGRAEAAMAMDGPPLGSPRHTFDDEGSPPTSGGGGWFGQAADNNEEDREDHPPLQRTLSELSGYESYHSYSDSSSDTGSSFNEDDYEYEAHSETEDDKGESGSSSFNGDDYEVDPGGSDDMAIGGGSDDGEEVSPGQALYYKLHLDDKLYSGARLSLREYIYFMLNHKVKNNATKEQFDDMCRFNHHFGYPEGNLCPPSFALMRRIIEAPSWSDHEFHVCDRPGCVGHVWEHVPKKQWKYHFDDLCPGCGGPRFVESTICGRLQRQPYRWYIDLLVEERIADFFNNEEWCRQRGKQRSLEPGSFWSSPEFTRLRNWAVLHRFQFDGDTSAYELLLDWVEPFNSVQCSVGIFAIRCIDIEPRNLGKDYNTSIVAIIPHPQPSNTQPYLFRTLNMLATLAEKGMQVTERFGVRVAQQGLQQFEEAGQAAPTADVPAGLGLRAGQAAPTAPTTANPTATGTAASPTTARTFIHHVFLTALLADTPAR